MDQGWGGVDDAAAITGLTELKFGRHLPENKGEHPFPLSSPNNLAVDLIKTTKWNNGEGEKWEVVEEFALFSAAH